MKICEDFTRLVLKNFCKCWDLGYNSGYEVKNMAKKEQYPRYLELNDNNIVDIQIWFNDDTQGGLDFSSEDAIHYKWLLYYNGNEIEFSDIDEAWVYPIFNGLSMKDLKEKEENYALIYDINVRWEIENKIKNKNKTEN